jgi:hypothetical protein
VIVAVVYIREWPDAEGRKPLFKDIPLAKQVMYFKVYKLFGKGVRG